MIDFQVIDDIDWMRPSDFVRPDDPILISDRNEGFDIKWLLNNQLQLFINFFLPKQNLLEKVSETLEHDSHLIKEGSKIGWGCFSSIFLFRNISFLFCVVGHRWTVGSLPQWALLQKAKFFLSRSDKFKIQNTKVRNSNYLYETGFYDLTQFLSMLWSKWIKIGGWVGGRESNHKIMANRYLDLVYYKIVKIRKKFWNCLKKYWNLFPGDSSGSGVQREGQVRRNFPLPVLVRPLDRDRRRRQDPHQVELVLSQNRCLSIV